MENKILNGDALTHLKELPDNYINCCMTSPPYWALRDYGSSVETIWDGKKGCKHEWEETESPGIRKGEKNPSEYGAKEVTESRNFKPSNFCSKCNAWKGQLGLEPTFDLYIKHLADIFDEVKRVLRKDGTCWVNLGDTYNAHSTGQGNVGGIEKENKTMQDIKAGNNRKIDMPDKSLCNIPARFSIEMQNRGWILRNVIIWHKPNCMPCSVKDRFTVDFEYVFFFVKNKKYYFETQYEPHKEIDRRTKQGLSRVYYNGKSETKEEGDGIGTWLGQSPQGRNKRTVWSICPKPFPESHFAVYPEELCETPIKSGCPVGGICLDPFFGAGTTGLVALKQNKKFIGIELNPEYIEIAKNRLKPYLEQTKLEVKQPSA